MGKDSEFYKGKKVDQTLRLRELISQLPAPAVDFIYSKEVTTQISTRIQYAYDLLTYFRFLQSKNPILARKDIRKFNTDDLGNVKYEDIMEYQRFLELNIDENEHHENGKRAIARKMSPLRGMYKYMLIHKQIHEDPTALVPLPRLKKDKNIVRMNSYEVRTILDAIKNGSEQMTERQKKFAEKTRYRDLCILTLMLNTGIRVSECNGLDVADINLKDDSFVIVRKGGAQDVLYFGSYVHEAINDYLQLERKHIIAKEGHEKALFLSLQGKRMSVDAIENLVKKYAKIAVPNKKITPHKLRSTYGTALYRETGDIRLVADVLGHENINTTIDYYAAIEDEHKRQARNAVDFNRDK
ncbi:MAG: tyrosine-type recombinase/integrase [Lachnospiraceae bacterium]|nr:tyrosine-type recombinase/integrase [Lachnospiraceae bacterium]